MPAVRSAFGNAALQPAPYAAVRMAYDGRRVLGTKAVTLAQAHEQAVRWFKLPRGSHMVFKCTIDGHETEVVDDGGWSGLPSTSWVEVHLTDEEPEERVPCVRMMTPNSRQGSPAPSEGSTAPEPRERSAAPEPPTPAAMDDEEEEEKKPVVKFEDVPARNTGLFAGVPIERRAREAPRPAPAGAPRARPNIADNVIQTAAGDAEIFRVPASPIQNAANGKIDSDEIRIRACSEGPGKRFHSFRIERSQSFRKLQEGLARVENVPPERIRIAYNFAVCDDSREPIMLGIEDGDTLDYAVLARCP